MRKAQTISLLSSETKWALGCIAVGLVLLCTNVLQVLGGPRPIYIKVINGLIMALALNITLFFCLTPLAIKLRFFLIIPLILSGAATAFVMWAYHVAMIPIVFLIYLWIGYKLLTEKHA